MASDIRHEVRASLHDDRGTWVVRGRVYDPETGMTRQKSKSTGFKVKDNTKRKAEARMREIILQWESEANAQLSTSEPLFSEYVRRWLDKKAVTRHENTVLAYQQYIDQHINPALGDLKVQEITPHILQGYVNDKLKTLSANSIKKHFAVIRGALREAVLDGVIPYNFAEGKTIEFPKIEKFRGKAYTPEQVVQLLKAAEKEGEPIRAAIVLAVCYGLRREEIAGLRWKDVDFESRQIHIRNTRTQNGNLIIEAERTKSESSRRTIDILETTLPYLHKLKQSQEESGIILDKVCVWPDGREVNPHYISQGTRHLMKKYDLEHIRLHDLRHTAATLLAQHATPKQVQGFLGHSTASLTMDVYTHLLEADRQATSRIMDGILKNSVLCSESCSESGKRGPKGTVKAPG